MEDFFDFYNIDENGSENVEYDIPELPVYIRDGNLSSLKDFTFKAHYHSDWEFIAVLNGSMKYSIDGEIISISEGESLFVNSNHIHFGFSDTGKDCDYICLIVHPSLFCNNPYIERNYVSPICNCNYPYLIIKETNFTNTILGIYNKKQENIDNLYLGIQQDLFNLIYLLFNLLEKLPKAEQGQQSFSTIKAMLDYISENYGNKVTLTELAQSGNVCRNSCIHLFQKYTNTTPMKYLSRYRIEKACSLLKGTDKSIAEIAYDCGFSGSSYFAEIFSLTMGVSPKKYRSEL